MKNILFPCLIILLPSSSAHAAKLLGQSTDGSGMTLYTIECDNGSMANVSGTPSQGTFASSRGGSTEVFSSLSDAARYACGE